MQGRQRTCFTRTARRRERSLAIYKKLTGTGLVSFGWKCHYFSSSACWPGSKAFINDRLDEAKPSTILQHEVTARLTHFCGGIPTSLGAEQDSARNTRQSLRSWQESVLYIGRWQHCYVHPQNRFQNLLSLEQVFLPEENLKTIPKSMW